MQSTQFLIEFKNIEYKIKEKIILKNFNLIISPKEKIGILQNDSQREAIFYNLIKNNIQPDSGNLQIEPSLKVEFLDSSTLDWNEEDIALEYLIKNSKQDTFVCIKYASLFGFTHNVLELPIKNFPKSTHYILKLISVLAKEPDYIIVFQPTLFLNVINQILLEKILKKYFNSKGFLIISNDLEILENSCDVIYFLKEDKLQTYQESSKNHKNFFSKINLLKMSLTNSRISLFIKRLFSINKTILKANFKVNDPTISPFSIEAKLKLKSFRKYTMIGIFGENIKLLIRTIIGEIKPTEGDYKWLISKLDYVNIETIENLNQNLSWKDLAQFHYIFDLSKLTHLLRYFDLETLNLYDSIKNSNIKIIYKMNLIFALFRNNDVLILEYPEQLLTFNELKRLGYLLQHRDQTILCISNNRSFINTFAPNVIEVQTHKIYNLQIRPKRYFLIKKSIVEKEFKNNTSQVTRSFFSYNKAFNPKINGTSPVNVREPNDLLKKKKALLLFFDKSYRERKKEIAFLREELKKMGNFLKDIEKKREELLDYINKNRLYTPENYEKMKQLDKTLEELELRWYELQKKLDELEQQY